MDMLASQFACIRILRWCMFCVVWFPSDELTGRAPKQYTDRCRARNED